MKIEPGQRKILIKFLKNKLADIASNRAVIVSPFKLSNEQTQLIIQNYSFLQNCQIEYKIDTSLIGGYIIMHKSSIIDASIKNQIENIKDKIFNN